MAGRNSTTEPPTLTLHICTGACGLSLSLRRCVTAGIFSITWLMNPPIAPLSLSWVNFKFIDSSDRTILLPRDLCLSYRICVPFVTVHVIMTLKSSDTMCLQSETVQNRSTLSSVNLPPTFQVSVLAGLNVITVITSASEVMWQPAFVSVHLSEQINSWMSKFQWNSSENVGVSQSRSWLPFGEVPEGSLIFQN